MAIRPAGNVITMPSRPVDVAVNRAGTRAYVKDNQGLRVIDLEQGTIIAQLGSPGGASLTGIALNRDETRVYLSSASNLVHEFDVTATPPKLVRSLSVPGPKGKGNSFPCGLTLSPDNGSLLVCLSLNNSLAEVDLATGKVSREIPVGIAPYDVVVAPDGKTATVSLMGGPLSPGAAKTAPSAGTEVPVDKRGVAIQGGVAVVGLGSFTLRYAKPTPRQNSALASLSDGRVLMGHANDDSVSVLTPNTGAISKPSVVKPDPRLAFGSMPSALAVVGSKAYVALAGNNAVAVMDITTGRVRGLIPTGWYPSAVEVVGQKLIVTSAKGLGARGKPRPTEQGRNSYDYAGTLQVLPLPSATELAKYTQQVRKDALVPQMLRESEIKGKSTAKPVPVPRRIGDPSPIRHVVYVIKENRTYDQVFGDMKVGDSDPKLCVYPDLVTPNHHAIAREFALLDNYYCNGVLSADGHSWATEGNVTPYLERAFGGFNRSYTFGDDPLTYSQSGFIWDRVLEARLSFRNFGEMNYSQPPAGMKIAQLLAARDQYLQDGTYPEFKHNIGIERLRRYSDPKFPGWNMEIPDVVRMDRFLTEFRRWEKEGGFPNFVIVYLPQDHGGSSVTARANVADNDLAVGRLIEALSKSKYWKETVAFINEDDPQGGFDHVDGHRSICLVASPYTRGRGLVSNFYNQTSVIHTMLRILGLPPLNQRDASSPLMTACFRSKADLTPYQARPNRVPLDETKVPGQSKESVAFSTKVKNHVAKIPRGHKTPADEDLLNRMIWHEAKGMQTPYPTKFAGPHGRGLKARGLTHGEVVKEDDDE